MGARVEEIEARDDVLRLDARIGLILTAAYEACEERCAAGPYTCLGCVACDIKAKIEAAAGPWDVLW